MRGLLLISLLAALVAVGYLVTQSMNQTGPDGTALRDAPEKVQQDIQRATEEHLKNLRRQTD
jgi:hypothetical protein